VYVGIAVMAVGLAFGSAAAFLALSASGVVEPEEPDSRVLVGSQDPGGFEALYDSRGEGGRERAEYAAEPHRRSFADRFAGAFDWSGSRRAVQTEARANDFALQSVDPSGDPAAPQIVNRPIGTAGASRVSPPANVSKKPSPRMAYAIEDSDASPGVDDHTAIYDIAARTVYLPNGQRLEAHSGLGGHLDDPQYVNVKDRGPTPPNVYSLALREELFHGVRAIRLTPAGGGNMFGRDGMLAHSYMLGASGQSNGCVSFRDYPRFLNAFLNGEVDRLVVVKRIANAPGSQTAGSGWLPATIKALFGSPRPERT
jgi:hypothetical protein